VKRGRRSGEISSISESHESYRVFYPSIREHWILMKRVLPSYDRYEKKVKDFNFGSLIRTDARQEYSEINTIFGPIPNVIG
jgi:hypothetical protein